MPGKNKNKRKNNVPAFITGMIIPIHDWDERVDEATKPHSKLKKFFVNPYLFLLAKRMLDYEFVGLGNEPSDTQLAHFIYDRYKKKKFESTSYSDRPEIRDSSAYSKAEAIRKYILKPKDFRITEEKLDQLVQEITKLGSFKSWFDFVFEKIGLIGYSRAIYLCSEEFINEEIRNELLTYVNNDIFSLHKTNTQRDVFNNPPTLLKRKDLILRTANMKELKEIIEFTKNRDLLTDSVIRYISSLKVNKNFHEEFHFEIAYNPQKDFRFVFVLVDSNNNEISHAILLPLKSATYEKLKNGIEFIHLIEASDLLPLDEIESIECIYFHFYPVPYARTAKKYKHLIKSLMNLFALYVSENIVFCTCDDDDLYFQTGLNREQLEKGTIGIGFEKSGERFKCGIQFYERRWKKKKGWRNLEELTKEQIEEEPLF